MRAFQSAGSMPGDASSYAFAIGEPVTRIGPVADAVVRHAAEVGVLRLLGRRELDHVRLERAQEGRASARTRSARTSADSARADRGTSCIRSTRRQATTRATDERRAPFAWIGLSHGTRRAPNVRARLAAARADREEQLASLASSRPPRPPRGSRTRRRPELGVAPQPCSVGALASISDALAVAVPSRAFAQRALLDGRAVRTRRDELDRDAAHRRLDEVTDRLVAPRRRLAPSSRDRPVRRRRPRRGTRGPSAKPRS